MTIRTAAAAIFFVLVAATSCLSQGLYWESNTDSPLLKQKTLHSSFYFMPGRMKQESKETGSATIFRLDKKLLISLNQRNRTYSEMTFDDLEGMMKKKNGALDGKVKAMQEQMKNMPEAQRKMMEKAMGGAMPGAQSDEPVRVAKTGNKKSISGFACAEYSVQQGDKTIMTIWATKDIAGYAAMQKDLAEFGRRLAALNPVSGKSMSDAMKQLEGFPILTHLGETLTTTVVKVESRSTPASDFEIPAGYRKTPSPFIQP